ncbi:Putative sodium-coupled neutral amino acid transporter 11 [Seminavis robusta]|uniref:Sodium-coupled neutral amino acid transporter 11 n=1 Tax=Seminavis robusta TaxID=568900 RepID=A0A9N8E710_9STRA|nr:Putative sodium-coupled neutral amino acid transporter 11 [Seminavis robusta]|eukprot:Sro719_g192370.1 Putative sodium-coupled neutral amino acid transporter 11 (467) ;mRNA; f:32223-33752
MLHFRTSLLLLALLAGTASALVPPVTTHSVTNLHNIRGGGARGKRQPLTKLKSDAAAAVPGESGDGTATIPNEVFNLVKGIVGSGVLSLPYGIAVYGNAPSAVLPATILITIMGMISAYTFGLIGRVCQATDTMSYSDAWDATIGSSSSALIAFSCFFDCFAGCLSYSMILADTFVNLLAFAGVSVTRTQSLLGVTGFVLTPLCFLKNLKSLAPFSLVGILGMLYTFVAMAIRYFGGAYAVGGAFRDTALKAPVFGTAGAASAWSPKALILTCMLSNAYIAHFNAPKFLKELKNNTMPRFHQVIGWSFGASVLLYAGMSALGFLTFGAASNGLILNSYSNKDLLMSIARFAVAISVTFSYPLCFIGARDGLLDMFKYPQEKRDNGLLNKMTIGMIAVVTAMAAKLTDLGLVASVGGATFGTALVFVYPTLMMMKLKKNKGVESKIAGVIALLGVVMGVIGTKLSFE